MDNTERVDTLETGLKSSNEDWISAKDTTSKGCEEVMSLAEGLRRLDLHSLISMW